MFTKIDEKISGSEEGGSTERKFPGRKSKNTWSHVIKEGGILSSELKHGSQTTTAS